MATNDVRPLLSAFSTSFHGKRIDIDYVLKIFVKHDAYTQGGEGEVVSLPIQIMTPPTRIMVPEPEQVP